jgi:hypothetical protein
MRISVLVALCAIAGCHRAPAPPSSSRVVPEPALSDPAKAVAVRDLKESLAAARAAVARHESPVYAADKLALAARELDGEKDAGMLALLSEAETVYGHDAPVAWADAKLSDAEAHADKRGDDCATARAMLDRVSGKYKEDAAVLALVKRVKATCPRARDRSSRSSSSSSSGGGGAAASASSRAAQTGDCRRRCDDAAFDCRSRCQYCGTCTTDKTWEQCNAICNTCRQGCEQNERFCQSACGN